MQSLKWRLSFQTKQSVRPAKKLWVEYFSLTTQEGVWSNTRKTLLLSFLDAADQTENSGLTSWIDEIDQSRVQIIEHLVDCLEYTTSILPKYALSGKQVATQQPAAAVEEATVTTLEINQKLISVLESIILGLFQFHELIELGDYPPTFRVFLQALASTHVDSHAASLLKMLKALVCTSQRAHMVVEMDCVRTIIEALLRLADDRTFLFDAIAFLNVLLGNVKYAPSSSSTFRSRGLSTSSAGSASIKGVHKRAAKQQHQQQAYSRRSDISPTTLDFKTATANNGGSFNFSWMALNDLIRWTPFGNMIFGAGKAGDIKDDHGTGDFGYDGAAQVLLSNLTKDDIESELLRLELLYQTEAATEEGGVEERQSAVVVTLLNNHTNPAISLPNGAKLIQLALEAAKSDSELLEAIRLFAIITIQSRSNLRLLIHSNGLSAITQAIQRYISTTSSTPETVATRKDILRAEANEIEDEFVQDSIAFQCDLLSLLVRITFDSTTSLSLLDVSPLAGDLQNIELIIEMSSFILHDNLDVAALSISFLRIVLKLYPLCVALFDKEGIILKVIKVARSLLIELVKGPVSGTVGAQTQFVARMGQFQQIIVFLYEYAVVTKRKDNYTLSTMALLLLDVTQVGIPDNFHERQVCMNCELDVARWHCLHESCAHDRCSMLCQDCDAVFHKALHKRSHIRLSRASVEESSLYSSLRHELLDGMPVEWQAVFQGSAHRPLAIKSSIALWTLVGVIVICVRFVLDAMKEHDIDIPAVIMSTLCSSLRVLVERLPSLQCESDELITKATKDLLSRQFTDTFHYPRGLTSKIPPSGNMLHPSRIALSLLISALSVCIVGKPYDFNRADLAQLGDDDASHSLQYLNHTFVTVVEKKTGKEAFTRFLAMEGDSLLVFLSCRSLHSSDLITTGDRQSIWWFLRELFVVSQAHNDDSEFSRVICWFTWMLKGRLSSLTHLLGARRSDESVHPSERLLQALRGFIQPSQSPAMDDISFHLLMQEVTSLLCLVRKLTKTKTLAAGLEQSVEYFEYALMDTFHSSTSRHTSKDNTATYPNTSLVLLSSSFPEIMFSKTQDIALAKKLVVKSHIMPAMLLLVFGDAAPDFFPLLLVANRPTEKTLRLHLAERRVTQDELHHRGGHQKLPFESWKLCAICLCCLLDDCDATVEELDHLIDRRAFITLIHCLLATAREKSSCNCLVQLTATALLHLCCSECEDGGGRTGVNYVIAMPGLSGVMLQSWKDSEAISLQCYCQDGPVASSPTSRMPTAAVGSVAAFPLGYAFYDELAIHCAETLHPKLGVYDVPSEIYDILTANDFAMFDVLPSSKAGSKNELSAGGRDSAGSSSKPPVGISSRDHSLTKLNLGLEHDLDYDQAQRTPTVKRTRKYLSSSSLQSFGDVLENKWEVESIGKSSAAFGEFASRASVGSNHSVSAIMTAMKAMPIQDILGDRPQQLQSQTTKSTVTAGDLSSVDKDKQQIYAAGNGQTLAVLTDPIYPFPALIMKGTVIECSVYSDILFSLFRPGGLGLPMAFLLLHNTLINKCGITGITGMNDNSTHETAAILPVLENSSNEEHYPLIIRKHLSWLLLDSDIAHSLSSSSSLQSGTVPLFRSLSDLEAFIVCIVLAGHADQQFLLQLLVNCLLKSSINMSLLCRSPSLCVVVLRMINVLPSALSDAFMNIVSQALAANPGTTLLRHLIDRALLVRDEYLDCSDEYMPEMDNVQALYVIGQALDLRHPAAHVQFTSQCLLTSPLLLKPSRANIEATSSNAGWSLNMWIKLEGLDQMSVGIIFRMKFDSESDDLTAFFRSVYTDSTSSSGSCESKRQIQLCFKLSHASSGGIAEHAARTQLEDLLQSLTTSLTSFALPDYILNYDWSAELGSWMLLQLYISKDGQLACKINGCATLLLSFSPLGYKHDITVRLSSHLPTALSFCDDAIQHSVIAEEVQQMLTGAEVSDLKQQISIMFTSYTALVKSANYKLADVLLISDVEAANQASSAWLRSGPSGGLPFAKDRTVIAILTQAEISRTNNLTQFTTDSQQVSAAATAPDMLSAFARLSKQSSQTAISVPTTSSSTSGSRQAAGNEPYFFCNAMSLLSNLRKLGGYKVFIPLLSRSSALAMGALRILQSLLTQDMFVIDFFDESLDRVLTFAMSEMDDSVITDLYYLVLESFNGHFLSVPETSIKKDLLTVVIDIFIACPGKCQLPLQFSRFLLEHRETTPVLLEYNTIKSSILPLQIAASMWTLSGSGKFEELMGTGSTRISPPAADIVVPEIGGRGLRKQESLNNLSDEAPSIRKIAFETTVHPALTATKSEEQRKDMLETCVEAVQMLITISKVINAGVTMLLQDCVTNKSSMDELSTLLTSVLTYAATMFRAGEAASKKHTPTETKALHTWNRDNFRRLERLKARLRQRLCYAAILRAGNCFVSEYWQLYSAHVFSNIALDMLRRAPQLRKSAAISMNIPQLILEFAASSMVELRLITVDMLAQQLIGTDGKVDVKKVTELERLQFFEAFSDQLVSPRDCFDENIVAALRNLLFLSRPSSVRAALFHETSHVEIVEIALPQLLSVYFRLLQHCRSWDLLRQLLSLLVDGDQAIEQLSAYRVVAQPLPSISTATTAVAASDPFQSNWMKNVQIITTRRDWIYELTDIITAFRQRWLSNGTNNNEVDQFMNSMIGLNSDSESIGGFSAGSGGGGGVDAMSEPDNTNSLPDNSSSSENNDMSPDSQQLWRRGTGGGNGSNIYDPTALRRDLAERFEQPVRRFIIHLLLIDMAQKPGITRKWSELFRLSLPESNQLQEQLFVELIQASQQIKFLTSSHVDNESIAFNFLRNFGMLLLEALDKMKVSLTLCVTIIHAIEDLSYRCSVALRQRIKETVLGEVRGLCITRCLVEVGLDLHSRVAAVVEISASLQAYLLQPETKLFGDSAIATLLLDLFFDVFDEMQSLILSSSSSQQASSETGSIISNGSTMQSTTADHLRACLECMIVMFTLVQAALQCSSEGRKFIPRLVDGLLADPERRLARLFLPPPTIVNSSISSGASGSTVMTSPPQPHSRNNSLGAGTTTTALTASTSTVSTSGGSSEQAQTAQASSSSSSSYSSWWMSGWTSSNTAPPPPLLPSRAEATVGSKVNPMQTVEEEEMSRMEQGEASVSPLPSNGEKATSSSDSKEETKSENRAMMVVSNSGQEDVKSFVVWFCSAERRDLQSDLRQRVNKELRSAVRNAERIREKASQRLLKHVKALQDRRTRERLQASRAVSDVLYTTKLALDKMIAPFNKDVAAWLKQHRERLANGRDVYTQIISASTPSSNPATTASVAAATSVAVGRSPIRPTAAGFATASTATATDELGADLESFRIPTALVEHLQTTLTAHERGGESEHQSATTAKLTAPEAMHALLECFASCRRIIEAAK